MSAEVTTTLRPSRRPRRSNAERLCTALQTLAGTQLDIIRHSQTSWASITFAGTRHSLDIVFEGAEAVEAGENFIAALPDYEFEIPARSSPTPT